MKRIVFLSSALCVMVAVGWLLWPSPLKITSLATERFGVVQVYWPQRISRAALVFSDSEHNGASDFLEGVRTLLRAGSVVFVIDAEHYRAVLKAGEECTVVGGELERFSQSLQSSLSLERYMKPLLIGLGQGALLTFFARFHSPDRFDGTIASDLCAVADPGLDLCGTDQLVIDPHTRAAVIKPVQGTLPPVLTENFKVSVASSSSCQSIVALPPALVADQHWPDLVAAMLPLTRNHDSLDDVPVIELPAEQGRFLAVFISGDGGWAGIDENTGGFLRQHGVSVVGVSALKYFWRAKSADESAAMVERLFVKYRQEWALQRLVLIGYSLGADAVPLVYNRLSNDIQQAVEGVVLIAPERFAELQVRISDWIGLGDQTAGIDLLPEVERIPPGKVLCLYGLGDAVGVCHDLHAPQWRTYGLPGNHHFDGDYERIGQLIVEHLGKRQEPRR